MGNHQYLEVNVGRLSPGGWPPVVLLASCDPERSKKWYAIGTASLICHGGSLLLLTAAHAVIDLSGKPLVLKGPAGSVTLTPAQCNIEFHEVIDLAVIALNSNDLGTLFGICNCVALNPSPSSGIDSGIDSVYQICGFPTSKNRFSRTMGWRMKAFRISAGTSRPIPANSTLLKSGMPLMGFELNLDELLDNALEPSNELGALKGMSGGPVVRHSVTPEVTPGEIVGIFLEWHEKTAVVLHAAGILECLEQWGYGTHQAN